MRVSETCLGKTSNRSTARRPTVDDRMLDTIAFLDSEVRRLQGRVDTLETGIRDKCERWDRDDPAQLAFVVAADFRSLLGEPT